MQAPEARAIRPLISRVLQQCKINSEHHCDNSPVAGLYSMTSCPFETYRLPTRAVTPTRSVTTLKGADMTTGCEGAPFTLLAVFNLATLFPMMTRRQLLP